MLSLSICSRGYVLGAPMHSDYSCPVCGDDDSYEFIVTKVVSHRCMFDSNGYLGIEKVIDSDPIDDEVGVWYCGSCATELFTGTKAQFQEYMEKKNGQ